MVKQLGCGLNRVTRHSQYFADGINLNAKRAMVSRFGNLDMLRRRGTVLLGANNRAELQHGHNLSAQVNYTQDMGRSIGHLGNLWRTNHFFNVFNGYGVIFAAKLKSDNLNSSSGRWGGLGLVAHITLETLPWCCGSGV